MDPTPTRWVGWLRRDRRCRWERVCEAADLGEAHRQLLAEADRCGITDSRCRMLTSGAVPFTRESDGKAR